MQVRPATPSDAAGIAAVHVASWQRAYSGLLPQDFLDGLSVEARTDTWHQVLSQPTAPGVASTLVGELEGRIIGFASVGPSRDDDAEPGTQELWGIYLHPDCWGAGHGHALHAHALAALRANASSADTEATLWSSTATSALAGSTNGTAGGLTARRRPTGAVRSASTRSVTGAPSRPDLPPEGRGGRPVRSSHRATNLRHHHRNGMHRQAAGGGRHQAAGRRRVRGVSRRTAPAASSARPRCPGG